MFSPVIRVKLEGYEGPQITYEEFENERDARRFGKGKYRKDFICVVDLDQDEDEV